MMDDWQPQKQADKGPGEVEMLQGAGKPEDAGIDLAVCGDVAQAPDGSVRQRFGILEDEPRRIA